jgi:hypothetical protein
MDNRKIVSLTVLVLKRQPYTITAKVGIGGGVSADGS